MVSDTDAIDQSERIPHLEAGRDPLGVPCSPQESYLLSRVDGPTPWSALRAMGGMPAERADALLERWLARGILRVEGGWPGEGRTGPPGDAARADEGIDPDLDLSTELQARILALDSELESLDYFQLLGVERDADARSIKRAYFALSRDYHPDRYFRKSIGAFAARLDRIFKRIVEAYELLHDPSTRAEVERHLRSEPIAPPAPKPGAVVAGVASQSPDARADSRIQHLSRLRQSFRPKEGVSMENRYKARRFYQAAELALEVENFLEAAANARLAIAFDPSDDVYRRGFAAIQAEVHRLRASESLQRASRVGAEAEALEHLEEAIHYRPSDVGVSTRAASLSLAMGDPERALLHAQNAADIEPECASHHLLCARVMRRLGDFEAAGDALERAACLEGDLAEVAAEREQVERKARG